MKRSKLAVILVFIGAVLLAMLVLFTSRERVEVMPLDETTLEQFQEASSRAMSQSNGLPYAVAASASLRMAMAELGHDPDKTLLYWMSPRFQKDLANRPEAMSISRSTANLLSLALGDQAGDEDFALILKQLSTEVRAAAIERRSKE
ncbi:MAG TPA: hypothetical protein DCZ95_14405 [Verrucomicrobia bacterium]|nr:MAG: hypothetical protein A2X46_07170 [Lentisphaerae bacterium GWF2_57_35]HBA85276.1 hypothetical protein [Verrucomicrobiota bacterium]